MAFTRKHALNLSEENLKISPSVCTDKNLEDEIWRLKQAHATMAFAGRNRPYEPSAMCYQCTD